MIASSSNKCNIKSGDFPTCRLTAPIVINSLKLQSKTTNSIYSPPQVPVTASAAVSPPDITNPISSTPQVPATTPTASSVPAQIPHPITNALSLLPTASIPAPRPSASAAPPHAPQTPSRSISYQPPAHTSPLLQSQARALPSTPTHIFSLAPVPTPPVAMRTSRRKAT